MSPNCFQLFFFSLSKNRLHQLLKTSYTVFETTGFLATWLLFSKGERCHCFLYTWGWVEWLTHVFCCEQAVWNLCKQLLNILLFRDRKPMIWCISYSVELWDRNTDVSLTNRAQKHGRRKLLPQGKFSKYSQSSEITLICQVLWRVMECVYMHRLLFKHIWYTQHEHTCTDDAFTRKVPIPYSMCTFLGSLVFSNTDLLRGFIEISL